METNWASEHLQVIRTLMERTALYRRALAPIMLVTGAIGLAGALVPCFVQLHSNRAFALLWLGVSVLALTASYLLVRRQALKAAEPFWSLPTRRVTQALLPAFVIGLAAGLWLLVRPGPDAAWLVGPLWAVAYGWALHGAGFFMPRGIRLFGWLFVLAGCAWFWLASLNTAWRATEAAHYGMGLLFGVAHLAYGAYLHFTEKHSVAA
jgi:hypothetical protein